MRPLEQSVEATSRDVAILSRVLQRVTAGTSQDPLEQKQIADHLRAAITLLVGWTAAPAKNGSGSNGVSGLKGKPGLEKVRLRGGR